MRWWAGIVARWALTPSQRQLLLVQTGHEPVCAPGFFFNAECEKRGQFSRPLYRDLPMGGLVHAALLLVAPEEGQLLITTTAPGQLRMVRLSDVGQGLERHLRCNLSVPTDLLRRLDRELARATSPR